MGGPAPIPPAATTYAFIDGGYLRSIAREASLPLFNPRNVAIALTGDCSFVAGRRATLSRTFYFDAEPDGLEPTDELSQYWEKIESLTDTHLGFGWLRGKSNRRGPRQKAVDTLMAVEMISGAYTGRYGVAILVTGDADFVPVVNEIRRAGPHILVAASSDPSGQANFQCSKELQRAADRFIELPSSPSDQRFGRYFVPL